MFSPLKDPKRRSLKDVNHLRGLAFGFIVLRKAGCSCCVCVLPGLATRQVTKDLKCVKVPILVVCVRPRELSMVTAYRLTVARKVAIRSQAFGLCVSRNSSELFVVDRRIARRTNLPLPFLVFLLLLARIPAQLTADTVDPVFASPALSLHAGKGITAGADRHVVSGE